MKHKYLSAGLLALIGWTGSAYAQVGLGTPIAPDSNRTSLAPPQTTTDCKPRPNHPILGSIARTIRAAAGHLMPPAPVSDVVPTREEIARMVGDSNYSHAEVTAAKIKLDEAQARARRAAVKYLATVDCNYYPEAEAGLVAALRADRSESVRYEAAVALGTCRGLTMKIVEALNLTVLGFDLDGNPPETSERVRVAARNSLNRSLTQGMSGLSTPEPTQMVQTIYWSPPDPFAYQPMTYVPIYPPALPPLPLPPKERELAQTVSVHPAPHSSPRPLQQFLASVASLRDSILFWRTSLAPGVDPRLQGLTPLGSETLLSIPSARGNSAAFQPSPYNDR